MSPRESSRDDLVDDVVRIGWLAKGFVFAVIGGLAFELARRGDSSESVDHRGALANIAEAPAGRLLVGSVGAGLCVFAAGQFLMASRPGDHSLLRAVKRLGWAGLGFVYAILGLTGLQIAMSDNSSVPSTELDPNSGPTSPEDLTAHLLDLPSGPVLVFAIGAGTFAVALYHIRKAVTRDFVADIDTSGLSPTRRRAVIALGVAGFSARGAILGVAGWLFILAARQHDSDEAAGLDESLRTLAEGPAGRTLLLYCAAGLLAAGVFDMVTYHRQQLA